MDKEVCHICYICRENTYKQNKEKYFSKVSSFESSFVCAECETPFSMGYELTDKEEASYESEENERNNHTDIHFSCNLNEHTKECLFQYDTCGKDIVNKHHLKVYEANNYVNLPNKCNIFSLAFPKKNSLDQRTKMHKYEKSVSGQICDKKCRSKSQLENYMTKHSKEKHFYCDICPSAFKYRFSLNTHMNIHDKNCPFICEICNKICENNSKLQYHLKKHSDEKPFKCNICDALFKYKENLKRHMNFHDKHRPFKCKICHKSFDTKNNLQRHMDRHSVKKTCNKCNICDDVFKYRNNLIRHMYIHKENYLYKCKS